MRAMELEARSYEVDGRSFPGWLADGSGGRSAPGILVVHEGPGLTEHCKERARRLGELGYVAYAMDLYGEPGLSLERAKEIVRELRADRATLVRRTGAALDLVEAHPGADAARSAAIGFCFGGTAVLELARSGRDLRAVVGFHAGLDEEPRDGGAIRARVLMCLGAADPVVTARHRDAFTSEMTTAGVDWQMILYGGVGHSFTNREIEAYDFPGFAYDEVADRRSWRAMRAFLDEVLGPAGEAPSAR